MKKSLTIMILMFTLLFAFATTAHAADSVANGTCGDNLTWTLTDDGILTISGTGEMYDYSFSAPNWTPWTPYKDAMTSVVVEAGITYIGEYAFYSCYQMESISIPDTVTAIGYRAFNGCLGLEDVYITDPSAWCKVAFDGQEANPAYVGDCVHIVDKDGNDVTNVVLDDSVTAIPNYAFYRCLNLKSIVLPEGVTSIGDYAFYNCTSLQSSVSIPKSVTSIGKDAFYGCSNLTDVYITDPSAWCKVTFGDSLASPACYSDCLHIVDEDGNDVTNVVLDDTVTAIPDYAFYNCSNLKSITLPDGLTSIGRNAFSNCDSLTSITIPDSVTSIDNYAFYDCIYLTDVYITDPSAWCKISFANDYANPARYSNWLHIVDKDGNDVTDVVLDDTVTSIPQYAFKKCNMQSITIPDSVTSIGKDAFYGCSNLTDVYITDPSAWCKISFENTGANPAYYSDCLHIVDGEGNEITDVVLDDTITAIPDYAFSNCRNLKSITLPDGLTSIGRNAFSNCNSLQTITIPGSVTAIGRYAFQSAGLKSVTLLDGVTVIGQDMFNECNSLQTITIPDSVTAIGTYAFNNCSGLTDVYISDPSAWCKISFGNINANPTYYSDCLHIVDGEGNEITDVVLNDTVTVIPDYAFSNCSGMKSISIPNSVTSIGYAAFRGCDNLEAITIPGSVTAIGRYAFQSAGLKSVTLLDGVTVIGQDMFNECNSLQTITIPNSVTSIGDQAFYHCDSLQSISIPDSVTAIGYAAFRGCDSLEAITIPGSVTAIGRYAFQSAGLKSVTLLDGVTVIGQDMFNECNSLQTITIPNSVTSIGDQAFYHCDSLQSITIPDSVTSIGIYAFAWCKALTTVVLEQGLTTIGANSFYECQGLQSITIPDSVTSIGANAFYDCKSLTSITIPDSVTSIGNGTFRYCSKLQSISIPKGVTSIGKQAFYYCSSLQNITIPGSVTSIGDEAFRYCSKLKQVYFDGNKPEISSTAFHGITATCYYYHDTDGWDSPIGNYGGTLTWTRYRIHRLSGKGRCETAILAADTLKNTLGVEKFDSIIIASGSNFADALGGSYLAAQKDAPILLYQKSAINLNKNYILENLSDDGVVYLLGGTAAVPETMEDALAGVTVKRLSGKTRFDTNLKILEEAGVTPGQEILVCTGYNFADSLSASATGLPILMVNSKKDVLTDGQMEFLDSMDGSSITIIGGSGAVSDTLAARLMNYGAVSRLSGKTRYETSTLIAEKYFDSVDTAVLAYGKNFPDGLCGGPVAHAMGAPLILTAAKSETAAAAYVAANPVSTGYILGGTAALSDGTVNKIFQ